MDSTNKNKGYGFLINWIISFGDLILINILLFLFFSHFGHGRIAINLESIIASKSSIIALLTINLTYFITLTWIPSKLSSNIISTERIIQRSVYFSSLYFIIVAAGFTLLNISKSASIGHWLMLYAILTIVMVSWHMSCRIILRKYRRDGYNYRTVVIVGGGINGISIYQELKGSDYGYKILGFFDDNINSSNALPDYLGKISEIQEFAKNNKIDEIYCTLPGNNETKILDLISYCEKNMIRFFLVPESYKYIKRRFVLCFLKEIPLLAVRYEPLQHLSNRFLKRVFDIIFSGIVLITIFPFIYIIFGLIIKWTSPGPIFFKQKRTGFKGEEFYCYKFRSMRPNDSENSKSATKEDPRVTKIGAFMRKTSIDELPQFINVFIGDMSIVGPRPHMIKHTSQYSMLIDKFMVRHLVKPGITGWAQVNGFRGETKVLADMEGRVKKDVWYIENWSFFLDLKIIFLTVVNIFKGEDMAY